MTSPYFDPSQPPLPTKTTMRTENPQTANPILSTSSKTQENVPPTSYGPQHSIDQNQGNLNPYYLPHNDNTSLVLVTELLTEENYVSWSRVMIIRLLVKTNSDLSMELFLGQMTISFPHGSETKTSVISWILN